jgi:hypothetical protein
VLRSPMLAHVFNTLSGLPVVRCMTEARCILSNRLNMLQDRVTRSSLANDGLTRWLGFYSDICVFLLASAIVFALVYFRSILSPASTILVLVHALSLTDVGQYLMRRTVDLEVYLTSCERVLEYSTLPNEEVRVCVCVCVCLCVCVIVIVSECLFAFDGASSSLSLLLADCRQMWTRSFWRRCRASRLASPRRRGVPRCPPAL